MVSEWCFPKLRKVFSLFSALPWRTFGKNKKSIEVGKHYLYFKALVDIFYALLFDLFLITWLYICKLCVLYIYWKIWHDCMLTVNTLNIQFYVFLLSDCWNNTIFNWFYPHTYLTPLKLTVLTICHPIVWGIFRYLTAVFESPSNSCRLQPG